jgi:hypothetical protein
MNIESVNDASAACRDALASFEAARLNLAFAVAERNIDARGRHYAPTDGGMAHLIALNSLFARKGLAREGLLAA